MKEYKKIYKLLNFPDEAIAISCGEIEIFGGVEDQPACCYGFPPAMIPIWSNPDAMIYTSYWKHWFTKRVPAFVKVFPQINFGVKEISRSFNQLYQYLIIQEICVEDELTDDVLKLSVKLGVNNIRELDNLTLDTGDDPVGLLELPEFQKDAPLFCYKDTTLYQGDFPHENMNLIESNLTQICSLEVKEALNKKIQSLPNCPDWLKNTNKEELFDKYLNNKEFSNAWFTLNSHGWLFKDTKKALQALGKAVDDSKFHALVEAWCSLNHTKYNDGY